MALYFLHSDKGIVGNPSTVIIDGALIVKKLKHNLLSIIQLCDKWYTTSFGTLGSLIEHKVDKERVYKGCKVDNAYTINLDNLSNSGTKCLSPEVKTFGCGIKV